MHHGITHEQCSALAVGQSGGLCLASGVNCSFKKSRVSSTETYNEDYRDKQQRESNNVTVNTTPPKKKGAANN